MPKELDIRALVESKMKAELVAIAEDEGVTYSPQGTKRHIAEEIVEAREAGESAKPEPVETPEASLETDEIVVPVEIVKHPITDEIEMLVIPTEAQRMIDAARKVCEEASAAFLAAGAVDGPERKARRDAKAKLYALLA